MRAGASVRLGEDGVALNVVRGVMAGAFGGFCGVERDLYPVLAAYKLVDSTESRFRERAIVCASLCTEGIVELRVIGFAIVLLVDDAVRYFLKVVYRCPLRFCAVAV